MIKYKQYFLENNILQENNPHLVELFEQELKSKYPALEDISLYIDENGYLYLADIRLNNRGQGIGTAVMNDIVNFADSHQFMMKLIPVPDDSSVTRLIKFYKRFGFVLKRDSSVGYFMVRSPKKY